ncbi:MAG: hypothetical protein CM15mP74_26440 [Halieaceae bacterium]|nr:MAG: hypothetical protein CM15mP74_26440 [Halieaceae bacterium]
MGAGVNIGIHSNEIGALHAIFSATAASNLSSASDSTLKHLIPASRARAFRWLFYPRLKIPPCRVSSRDHDALQFTHRYNIETGP